MLVSPLGSTVTTWSRGTDRQTRSSSNRGSLAIRIASSPVGCPDELTVGDERPAFGRSLETWCRFIRSCVILSRYADSIFGVAPARPS
jgi:hypothetical protein